MRTPTGKVRSILRAGRSALRKALDDPDPAVRLAAAAALLSGK